MALLGSLANHVGGALVVLVTALTVVSLVDIRRALFSIRQLLQVVVRSVLAFGAACLFNKTPMFGVTVDSDSLSGFFTLGFIFGLWPVEGIWKVIRDILVPPPAAPGSGP